MQVFRLLLKIAFIAMYKDGAIPEPRNVPKLDEHQRSILRRSFAVHGYPNETSLKELALQTRLLESQVLRWFRQKKPTSIKRPSKWIETIFIE